MIVKKKGSLGIGIIIPIVLVFFVFAIGIGLSSYVFDNIKATQVVDSTEYNTTTAVSEGVGAIADLFPAIGIVIAAIFIITLIMIITSVFPK